jgi:hypothetical protein
MRSQKAALRKSRERFSRRRVVEYCLGLSIAPLQLKARLS